jgi:hypothetical protein
MRFPWPVRVAGLTRKPTRIAALAASLLLVVVGSASAVTIAGTGEGTFTDTSGCIEGLNCQVSDTQNGEDTRLTWGLGLQGSSTLTAVDTDFSTDSFDTTVTIGQLTWSNTPIISFIGPASFDAVWTLSVNLTSPSQGTDSQDFNLHIVNTANPASDEITLTLADLSDTSLNFGNVVISDLHYVVQGTTGGFDDAAARTG